MTLSRLILEIIRDNPTEVWTTSILRFEALKRNIPLSYEYAKKILQRFAERGILVRQTRGKYIFSPQRDNLSHSKGQKGTKLRGMSHSNIACSELKNSESKCDKGTCHNSEGYIPLFRRMLAALTFEDMKKRTVSPQDFIRGPYVTKIGNPETKRRYFYRLVKIGVLEKKSRGKYKVNVDLARRLMEEGTWVGVSKDVTPPLIVERDKPSLITVSHHFRIKKAIPLTDEEFGKIAKYFWSKDPVKDYVNGVLIETYPSGEGDRSHGLKINTFGAIFHITYSYKKRLAKVMIYPKRKEVWTWAYYAEQLFGKEFVNRALKIGISSHFGLNLSEITKVLYEGEEIRAVINFSDFGSSGDFEIEGASEEGSRLAEGLIIDKLKTVGKIVDEYEVLKKELDEMSLTLNFIESKRDYSLKELKERLDKVEEAVGEIKDHVVQHTRFINLFLKSYGVGSSEGVEGYA